MAWASGLRTDVGLRSGVTCTKRNNDLHLRGPAARVERLVEYVRELDGANSILRSP